MAARVEQCVDTALFGRVCDYCDGGAIYKVIAECIDILTILIGAAAVIGIIVVGIMYMTSAGDTARQTKAKRRLFDIVVGIIFWGVFFGMLEFLIPGGVLNSTLDTTTTSCPEEPPESPTPPPSTTPPGEEPTEPPASEEEHGVRDYTMCNMDFNVIKITVDGVRDDGTANTGLNKFIRDKVARYHINQSDGRVYNLAGSYSISTAQNGHCDVVSKNLAYDMYYDTITADACSAGGRGRSAGFSSKNESKFQGTYDEIMAGKPVVHRVTINDGGSDIRRHFAVIVGVKKSANRSNLSASDFLFLETWGDGVLWNNIPGVTGGWRTNSSGSGCRKVTNQNRFPYDNYYYVPTSQTGGSRMDC